MLKQFIKDCLTEKDGASFCLVRFGFLVTLVSYTAGIGHDFFTLASYVFSDHAKDIASGYGNILGYGGIAVAGKNFTESPS